MHIKLMLHRLVPSAKSYSKSQRSHKAQDGTRCESLETTLFERTVFQKRNGDCTDALSTLAPSLPRTGRRARPRHPNRRRSFGRHGAFISFIGDPVQGPGKIVGDDERPVGELRHVHRTPVIGALVVESALRENFRLVAGAIGFQRGKRDPRADGDSSVPRPVLGEKHAAPVFCRKVCAV